MARLSPRVAREGKASKPSPPTSTGFVHRILNHIAIALRPESQSPFGPEIQVFRDSGHGPNQQLAPIPKLPRAWPARAGEDDAVQLAIGWIDRPLSIAA